MDNETSDAELPETVVPSSEKAAPPASPEPADAAPAATSRFAVPLTIEIESALVPIERLQALREGALIPVAADSGTIAVRILASGRPLARGTLVSVGEGYGVLIGDDPLEA